MALLNTFTGDLSNASWTKTAVVVSGSQNEIGTYTTNTSTANLLWNTTGGDITDNSFSFKMPTMVGGTSAPSVELRDAGGTVQWRLLHSGTSWVCRQQATNVGTAITDTHFGTNPFFRFRHASAGTSTMFFETSPNGNTWNTQNSVAVGAGTLTVLIPRFQISSAVTGTFVVSNVNGRGVAAAATAFRRQGKRRW